MMDAISIPKDFLGCGVVLQVVEKTIRVKNVFWRRLITGRSYREIPNNKYPNTGDVLLDPNNGAYMGVRGDDLDIFIYQFKRQGVDVLVLYPTAWDDLGRAVSFRETWHLSAARPAIPPRLGPEAQLGENLDT